MTFPPDKPRRWPNFNDPLLASGVLRTFLNQAIKQNATLMQFTATDAGGDIYIKVSDALVPLGRLPSDPFRGLLRELRDESTIENRLPVHFSGSRFALPVHFSSNQFGLCADIVLEDNRLPHLSS